MGELRMDIFSKEEFEQKLKSLECTYIIDEDTIRITPPARTWFGNYEYEIIADIDSFCMDNKVKGLELAYDSLYRRLVLHPPTSIFDTDS